MRTLATGNRSLRLASFAVIATTLATGSAFASSKKAGVLTPPSYSSLMPPTVGAAFTDPVFGTSVKRITNAPQTVNADAGGNLTWIETEYSTASAFNNDNSQFLLLHNSYFGLYNGDGSFDSSLPLEISASSEPRWARKDKNLLYYHVNNMLKSYHTKSGKTKIVHTFSEYSSITGMGESDISLDGDHFALAGDGHAIFVYQISKDQKFGVYDTGGIRFDSLYMTPKNNVIVSWYTTGTTRGTGQELFDINMNFLRQVGDADGHKHLTTDTNGEEVLIWTNSADPTPIPDCENGIVKIRLADAKQTCLAQLPWNLAVHITAPDGNGTAFVETYSSLDLQPSTSAWGPFTNELLQVNLDGSGVTRIAHHRSEPHDSYYYQPKMNVSRDGSMLLFSSNFDLQKISGSASTYSDTYMINLNTTKVDGADAAVPAATPDSSGGTSAASAGAAATAAPTVSSTATVRYEQNDSAMSYEGGWYPNNGGFNSGGSSTLAMDPGSKATLTFTGTTATWIGFSDAWSGIAQVYVDGSLISTVDTYSANDAAQKVQYSVSNLSNTKHTITIVPTGSKNAASGGAWVWVDAFEVTTSTSTAPSVATPAVSAPVGVIEQDNAAITYTGTWFPNLGAFNSGGSAVLGVDAGNKASLRFYGTAVQWLGLSDPWSGIAQVLIDGQPVATVDCYSASQKSAAVEYSASNLTPGYHTIDIVATGNHSSQSAGSWVWVDAFNVTR